MKKIRYGYRINFCNRFVCEHRRLGKHDYGGLKLLVTVSTSDWQLKLSSFYKTIKKQLMLSSKKSFPPWYRHEMRFNREKEIKCLQNSPLLGKHWLAASPQRQLSTSPSRGMWGATWTQAVSLLPLIAETALAKKRGAPAVPTFVLLLPATLRTLLRWTGTNRQT